MGEKSPGWKKRVCQVLGALPLLLVVALYWGQSVMLEWESRFGYGQVQDYGLPEALMDQFRLYDVDANGCIDPYEFSMLKHQLEQAGDIPLDLNYSVFQFQDDEIGLGKEAVVVQAKMEPLVISSMTKFNKGMDFVFGSPEKMLPGLLNWKGAYIDTYVYGAKNFMVFLPPQNWPIGETFYIVKDHNEFTPMNRYHPPHPSTKNALLHALLAQFHPNVFLMTRFGPKGTVGIVRARNKEIIDIVFRVHAEYQLNSQPNFPFWFTPAQFWGHLIADHDCEHIHLFELSLPTDKQLNIDMEWITGQGSNEVDIGYVPLMKVFSLESVPWEPDLLSSYDKHQDKINISSIVWDYEISMSTAAQKIEKFMYPFKQDITANASVSEDHKRYAQVALDAYRFPVESMVIDISNERVLTQINANNLLDSEGQSPMTDSILGNSINRNYLNFLKKAQTTKNT